MTRPPDLLLASCLLSLAFSLFPRPTVGQTVTGDLQGTVVDQSGAPVAGAEVAIEGAALLGRRGTVADQHGRFRLPALPPGPIDLHVTHIAYRQAIIRDVPIRLGATTDIGRLALQVGALELEPLVVTAATIMVDPVSSGIGINLDQRSISNLPVDRTYASLLTLAPHANATYQADAVSIGGSTGLENAYYIDGVNVTDPRIGAGGLALPPNFVQEMRIKEGGYQAEYGRAMGGVIDVVTRSGGDSLEVETFGFYSGSGIAGAERAGILQLRSDGFSEYDVGVGLGGPLAAERLRGFVAYNARVIRRDMLLGPFGIQADRQTSHIFAGKLDWRVDAHTDLTLSVIGDPTSHDQVGNGLTTLFGTPSSLLNADPFLNRRESGGYAGALHVRSVRGAVVLSGSAALYRGRAVSGGATDRGRTEPLLMDLVAGTWEGGQDASSDQRFMRASLASSATIFAGAHTLKLGAEYEENVLDAVQLSNGLGLILYDSAAYVAVSFDWDATVRNRVRTLYLQDSWAVGSGLTLNAGARWDGQYFIGASDSVAQDLQSGVQPRVGFVIDPEHDGRQKVFLSYGRYVQQFPLDQLVPSYTPGSNPIRVFLEDPRAGDVEPVVFIETGNPNGPLQRKVEGLEAPFFDEISGGYELAVRGNTRTSARVVHRWLGAVYGSAIDADGRFVVGNLGRGELDFVPAPERTYTALELSIERRTERLGLFASYVWSWTRGNYSGLFVSEANFAAPGNNWMLQLAEQARNSYGRLPSDRPHSFKLLGTAHLADWLAIGGNLVIQSGTPVNRFGPSSFFVRPLFLVRRGSAGRTPTIWDVNVRFRIDPSRFVRLPGSASLVVDLLHVGSPRRPVLVDNHYLLDDDPPLINPNYRSALANQPPMALRIGAELSN